MNISSTPLGLSEYWGIYRAKRRSGGHPRWAQPTSVRQGALARPGGLCPLGAPPELQKKDTSVTFWAELIFFCHTYDTSMTIIVTKPGIIIDVVGSYFYDKKS